MLAQTLAFLLAAAAPNWTPEMGKALEAEAFTVVRGLEPFDDADATGGKAMQFTARDAELSVRFDGVAGTYVWALRTKAFKSSANSIFAKVDAQRRRIIGAPKGKWGDQRFEFRIDQSGAHTLTFTLRENPGFVVDWLRLESGPITKLKPLCIDTALVEGGQPKATIVAPESGDYDPLVQQLVAAVRERTGAELTVWRSPAPSDAERGQSNFIAVGRVDDNELIRWLWGWGYTRCGPKSPTAGGYVIETVHDPFGLGKNVVVLGATDLAGVQSAVKRFAELLPAGPTLRLGHIAEVLEAKRGLPVAPKPDYIAYEKRRMAKWLRTGGERRLAKTSIGYGGTYYRTGQAAWAGLFLHGLYALQEHMLRRNDLHLGFRDAWLYRLVRTWDIVEELPAFTDADRLRMTNFILDLARDCRKVGYFRKMKPGYIRWNHQTVPALGMLWAGEYFSKYYHLPEAQGWSDLARMCFEPQLHAFKPLEDAQSYQWGTLSQTIIYSHASGDYTYFRSNNERRSAELAYMTLDNLGYVAAFGDCGASPSAGYVPIMAGWAEWFYRDPRMAWIAGKRAYGRAQPLEPVDLLGTVSFPLHREVWRVIKEGKIRSPMPPTCTFEQTFDKISLRSDIGPQHDYLLLDGYSRGAHMHYDGNAIVRFTSHGRIWLHDSDYIRAMPKYHNAVTIVRDGQSQYIPPVCALDLIANGQRTGMTRTVVRDYNGTDWTRTILWLKDECMVVLDELAARNPGHYALQCYWRTLGQTTLDGPTLDAVQTERALVSKVQDAKASGRAAMRFDALDAYLAFAVKLPAGQCELTLRAHAPHAAADSFYIDLDGKRVLTLGIAIGKFAEATANFNAPSAGKHTLRVYLRESPGAVLDWVRLKPKAGAPVTLEAEAAGPPAPKPPQHFFVTDLDGSRLKLELDADTGRRYWKWYPYAEPVVKILHEVASVRLEAGQRRVFANLLQATGHAAQPAYAAKRIGQTAVCITSADGPAVCGVGLQTALDAAGMSTDAAAFMARGDLVSLGRARSFRVSGETWLAASVPMHVELDLAAGRGVAYVGTDAQVQLKLPGLGDVAIAGNGAQVPRGRHAFAFAPRPQAAMQRLRSCLGRIAQTPPYRRPASKEAIGAGAAKLVEAWSADAGSAIFSIAAADLDGDGSDDLIAGTHAGQVRAYASNGKLLWTFATGGAVRSVATADINRDGRAEVIAGSEDCNVYALDGRGRKLWAYACQPCHGRPGRVATVFPADLDGDGKPEVIAGSDDWHYFALDANGKELWRYESVHGSTVGSAADLDGDGKQEVLMGTEYYWWRVVKGDGKLMFGVSHGPRCTAVWGGDLDGDGKGEVAFGSADSNVYLHRPATRHKTVWTRSLGDEVTDLAAIPAPAPGQKLLVASSASFNVFALDAAGQVVWRRPLGDVARALCVGDFDGDGHVDIAVGCEDETVNVLDAAGALSARASTRGATVDIVALQARGKPARIGLGTSAGVVQVFRVGRGKD